MGCCIMTTLSNYIRQLIEQGFEEDRIVSFLESYGYSRVVIDSSLSQAKQEVRKIHDNKRDQTSLYQQLYTYVYTMLQQGFAAESIRKTLIGRGYNIKVVTGILRRMNKEYYNGSLRFNDPYHKKHSSLALVIPLLAIIIVGGFLFLNPTIPFLEGQENTEADKTEVPEPPEEESPDTQGTGQERMEGTDGENQTDDVTGQESDENVTETTASQDDIKNITANISPDRSEDITLREDIPSRRLSRSDTHSFNRALKASSPETATKHCGQVEETVVRTECYTALAQSYENKSICEMQESRESVEDCYVGLVLNGQEELCDNMTLPDNQQFCSELKILSEGDVQGEQVSLG